MDFEQGKKHSGFTLIELMVVILIVAILAAVAIPILRGRIDEAKWTEGKTGAGDIATAIRALAAEKYESGTSGNILSDLGFKDGDLDGTYFTDDCYDAEWVYTPPSGTASGSLTFTVTVDAGASTRTNKPTTNPVRTLEVTNNGPATWSN